MKKSLLFKRSIAVILSMAMVISGMLIAPENRAKAADTVYYAYYENEAAAIAGIKTKGVITEYTEVTADMGTAFSGDTNGGWYIVKSNITINSRITVTGNVKLVLCDGKTLNVPKGITVNKAADGHAENKLSIYVGSTSSSTTVDNMTGRLYAGCQLDEGVIIVSDGADYNCAGIGGGNNTTSCGIIEINGGIIYVNGGDEAAGIGGGKNGNGGKVTINGGIIDVSGSQRSAGIGGGYGGVGGEVTINGGIVRANASDGGAGIGGGEGGNGGSEIYFKAKKIDHIGSGAFTGISDDAVFYMKGTASARKDVAKKIKKSGYGKKVTIYEF